LDQIKHLEIPPSQWHIEPDLKGIPVKRALAYTLWLIRLPQPHTAGIVKRLRFPRVIKDLIRDTGQLWRDLQDFAAAKPSDYAQRLEKTSNLTIYSVYLATDNSDVRTTLRNYVVQWKGIFPQTTGHDLHARGLPPGPGFKEILTRLRAAWVDGEIENVTQEIELLDQLIAAYQINLPPDETKIGSSQ